MGNTDKFDQIANAYDTSERIKIAEISSEAIRDYLVDTKNKTAIDFGCGTGLVGLNLLDEFQAMLFMDTSQNMITELKQKIAEMNLENVDTLCFDMEKNVPTDLHTDYIFMVQVLLHIRDTEMILSRLYDVLNDGGHLMIVDFVKNENVTSDMVHNGFQLEELERMMTNIGYTDIQYKTIHSGSKIFMGQVASMFVLDATKGG